MAAKRVEKKALAVSGEFSALEFEEIIRRIAELRSTMAPPVPESPPGLLNPDAEMQVQDATLFTARTVVGGGLRIYLRNEGIGWMAFNLTAGDVANLRDLLSKKLGHGHTAH